MILIPHELCTRVNLKFANTLVDDLINPASADDTLYIDSNVFFWPLLTSTLSI